MITLEGFKEWLATKNPEETFTYSDNYNCCVAQYCKQALGMRDVFVSVDVYYPHGVSDSEPIQIPLEIAQALFDTIGDRIRFGEVQTLFGVTALEDA